MVTFSGSLLQVLHETFPQHTFLMNGLVQGVKVRPDGAGDAAGSSCLTGPGLLLDGSALGGLTPNLCLLSGLPVVSLRSADRCSV